MLNAKYFIIGADILENLFSLILQGAHAHISHEAVNSHLAAVRNSLQAYELPEVQESVSE